MEDLGLPPLPTLLGVFVSGWSLVIGGVWMFFRGKIITEREHTTAMTQKDITIEDLRARLSDANAALGVVTKQRDVIADEVSATMTRVLQALPTQEDRR